MHPQVIGNAPRSKPADPEPLPMRKPIVPTALVLFVAALAACSTFTPRRGFNRVINDRNVQITAQRALDNDTELSGRAHIGTSVYNGVLLLIGEASTEEVKQRAEADVTGYEGVQRVVNLIDVMPLQSVGRSALDASLTARVKDRKSTRLNSSHHSISYAVF